MGRVAATVVENASLALSRGQIHALVGESGSGKSTLARMLGFVIHPTSGSILLDGARQRRARPRRDVLRRVQILFQDPYGSLNPLQRLRYLIGRPLRLHGFASRRRDVEAGVSRLLESVGLLPSASFLDRRPGDLSGGQRQRVVIARALASRPDVLLADEPVSMLDVSIRLEILDLLRRLSDEQGVAVLYVTHDIASARYISDFVSVMYAGRIVEAGPVDAVIDRPLHPYTRLLVDSTPAAAPPDIGVHRVSRWAKRMSGSPPSRDSSPGCPFQPRCPAATAICAEQRPPKVARGESWAECWNPVE
ncbi:ABC transporter ATP-binding protein [Homoserinibacter gongjuensis]|nr:ABC transporter ATP-binding protein [Homoserinibacter gongjuensis]